MAINKSHNSSYHICDSHCRASTGMPCPSGAGTLVLLEIGTDIADLTSFVIKLSKHLNLPDNVQFELIPNEMKADLYLVN